MIRSRLDELKALERKGVWETLPLSQCCQQWVDINKGVDFSHNCRSRYLAHEVRRACRGFNRVSSNEAFKLVISTAVTVHREGRSRKKKLLFVDLSMAYLHADVMNQEFSVELHTGASTKLPTFSLFSSPSRVALLLLLHVHPLPSSSLPPSPSHHHPHHEMRGERVREDKPMPSSSPGGRPVHAFSDTRAATMWCSYEEMTRWRAETMMCYSGCRRQSQSSI